MRRVATIIVATIGGLTLLASFHTSPGVATRSVPRAASPPNPPAGASPPTEGTSPSPVGSPTTGSPSAGTEPPTSAASTRRTIMGPVVSNDYGDVQVEVVVERGQLVDVEAVQLPSDRRRSLEISDYAGPLLRQEALQARSANIDLISGATYTSDSYAQSLQAALDQAGI